MRNGAAFRRCLRTGENPPTLAEADSSPGGPEHPTSLPGVLHPPTHHPRWRAPLPLQLLWCLDCRCAQTCLSVTLMRLEVCCCSSRAANGPAGCENLFHCLSLFSAAACSPLPERERVRRLIRGSSLGDPHAGDGCCGRWTEGANQLFSIPLARVNTGGFWSDSCIYLLAGSAHGTETPVC